MVVVMYQIHNTNDVVKHLTLPEYFTTQDCKDLLFVIPV